MEGYKKADVCNVATIVGRWMQLSTDRDGGRGERGRGQQKDAVGEDDLQENDN